MDIHDEIHKAFQDKNFSSVKEAQEFLDAFSHSINTGPRTDFHGLSPEDMSRFLYHPFDSADRVEFKSVDRASTSSAIIVRLVAALAAAAGDDGLKLTATGNLTVKLVQEIARAELGNEGYENLVRHGAIRSETDYSHLHVTRIVAVAAGLFRKYNGRLVLTRKCQKLLELADDREIYLLLLQTYAQKYNWGYQDMYPEIRLIQMAFLFTLYLLQRYGSEWRPFDFYEDAFLRAFPMAMDNVMPSTYSTPEESVRKAYTLRTLRTFVMYFGLAKTEEVQAKDIDRPRRIRKRPLLDEFLRFHPPLTRIDVDEAAL